MKRILTSIWFLALIIAIPAIIVFPPVFEKYNVELVSKELKNNIGCNNYFYDLNSDGKNERIESYGTEGSVFSIQCFTNENFLINQYNFLHFFHSTLPNVFFADVNDNNLAEVYGFTINKDSVFLNWVEPLDSLHLIQTKFITTINTGRREKIDVGIREMQFFDFDGDKNKDIVFSLAVGYNLFPRKLFVFHPSTNQLESTENFGSHFFNTFPLDILEDKQMELFCISSSSQNIPENMDIKHRDDRPRMFVFNSDLKIKYPPIEFPVGLAATVQYYFTDESKGEVIVLYNNYSSVNAGTFATKVNVTNNIFKSDTLFLNGRLGKRVSFIEEKNNSYLIFGSNNVYYRINSDLKILEEKKLKSVSPHPLSETFDVNEDSVNEYFISNEQSNNLWICFENFKRIYDLNLDESSGLKKVEKTQRKNEFLVNTFDYFYTYKVDNNALFYLKYPGYLIIYILTGVFIWLLQLARMRQIKEKLALQNQVHELQLKSLKNQLDPHFIFNTFNTIASVIKQGRNEEAYDVMVRFSKLVRKNMDDVNSIYTSLKDEINFVKDYLSIQKFRFSEMFDYKINIDKQVNPLIEIPKLLVQIHVENALKHGIRPSKKSGILTIKIKQETNAIKIEIEDNGIGRKKSEELNNENNGIGLKTIQQIIDLNNKSGKQKIEQKIVDLVDLSGKPAGTNVILIITI